MDEKEYNWGSGPWGHGPHHQHDGMHEPLAVDRKALICPRVLDLG